MQRCPYLHEMRERLLDQPRETLQLENMERANLLDNRQSATESHQVGTVVKVGAVVVDVLVSRISIICNMPHKSTQNTLTIHSHTISDYRST